MSASPNRIFEDPNLKNTNGTFFSDQNSISHAIYLIIILLLISLAIGMAVVNVPVFIQSRGIIRPSAEVNQILAPVQGIIDSLYADENQPVRKGQIILKLESEKETLQKKLLENELSELQAWLDDLKIILHKNADIREIKTEKIRLDFNIHLQQLNDIEQRMQIAGTDYQRYTRLWQDKFISQKEYEESALKYKSLQSEKEKLNSEKRRQWINESVELTLKESLLTKQISEINFFIEKSVIIAPVSGIIQGIRNNYKGEICMAGKAICNLIPDTGLMAEMFIPPKDIGFISPEQDVRLLIDSYDYKYWGVLKAKCSSISADVEVSQNQALYRVICSIPTDSELKYRNSKAKPGKGMTLTAQFLVMEKSVWQLLLDNAFVVISGERK
jgi:HlyD family secretion protein